MGDRFFETFAEKLSIKDNIEYEQNLEKVINNLSDIDGTMSIERKRYIKDIQNKIDFLIKMRK